MPTSGTMSAETSVVPGTVFDFALRIDVEKCALLLMACIEARVEVAFRHFGHVIFVQKLTTIAFFAQSSQPMLADNCLLFGFDMTKRAKLLIASA